MSEHLFNAADELTRIRELRTIRRRKTYTNSRLEKYRTELVTMRQHGASYRELTLWLKTHRININHTNVMRYLKKLPELHQLSEVNHAELS